MSSPNTWLQGRHSLSYWVSGLEAVRDLRANLDRAWSRVRDMALRKSRAYDVAQSYSRSKDWDLAWNRTWDKACNRTWIMAWSMQRAQEQRRVGLGRRCRNSGGCQFDLVAGGEQLSRLVLSSSFLRSLPGLPNSIVMPQINSSTHIRQVLLVALRSSVY